MKKTVAPGILLLAWAIALLPCYAQDDVKLNVGLTQPSEEFHLNYYLNVNGKVYTLPISPENKQLWLNVKRALPSIPTVFYKEGTDPNLLDEKKVLKGFDTWLLALKKKTREQYGEVRKRLGFETYGEETHPYTDPVKRTEQTYGTGAKAEQALEAIKKLQRQGQFLEDRLTAIAILSESVSKVYQKYEPPPPAESE